MKQIYLGLVFGFSFLIAPIAHADGLDGYVIVSSNDTISGNRVCYERCVNDADCQALEAGRCVTVDNLGGVCMALRPNDDPPQDRTLCQSEANICALNQVCGRLPGPELVGEFIAHKESRGFSVHLITEEVWGGGQDAIQKTDNLRSWLMANYRPLNLKYVLIIGDPRQNGDVPMRNTKPGMHAEQAWANPMDDVPTDYYFAELTGDWDLDGDGYLAEFAPFNRNDAEASGDFGEGGMERDAEVAVGRIPYYGVPSDLDHILQKTMDYENADGESIEWRKSALLAAEGANRIFFGEQIRNRILQPNDLAAYRVYDAHLCEAFGGMVDNCPSIDGTPDALHCSVPNVRVGIEEFSPGLVLWLTHGGGQGAAAVMNGPTADGLPDDKPFFTFQASCLNSMPSSPTNISYRLLKNGAIATIGATVISHGPGSEVDLRNSAGNAGMAYAYASRLLVEGMAAGDALNDLRRDIGVQNRWWYWRNYLNFNLWGDPSVGIYNHNEGESASNEIADMGVSPELDARVPMDEMDMNIDEEADASVSADAALADPDALVDAASDVELVTRDAGPDFEMIEPDANMPELDASSATSDAIQQEDDVAMLQPMTEETASGCTCDSSGPGGQSPSTLFALFIGGALLVKRRTM